MRKTLQQHIDETFGQIKTTKPAISRDQGALDRERAFQDRAKKIEKLRQQRVSGQLLVYEVVRHHGYWRVLHLNRHSKAFGSQTEALDEAQQTANAKAKDGHRVEVILRRTDEHQICPHDEH